MMCAYLPKVIYMQIKLDTPFVLEEGQSDQNTDVISVLAVHETVCGSHISPFCEYHEWNLNDL